MKYFLAAILDYKQLWPMKTEVRIYTKMLIAITGLEYACTSDSCELRWMFFCAMWLFPPAYYCRYVCLQTVSTTDWIKILLSSETKWTFGAQLWCIDEHFDAYHYTTDFSKNYLIKIYEVYLHNLLT